MELLVSLCNIAVFKGSGSIWGAKKKEKQSGTPSWMQSRFCPHFGTILGVILGAKIVKTATWIYSMVFMRFRGPAARLSRFSESLGAKAPYRFLEEIYL